MTTSLPRGDQWTFLTHHARVLPRTAGDPEVRVRDAAAGIGHRERRGLEQVLRRTALSALPDDANAGYSDVQGRAPCRGLKPWPALTFAKCTTPSPSAS
ncbi:hypothetical protein [Streptomyces sp. NPDC019539]|uniref:hypothetical protein n=1 Tax=Streptomyces sp. NPDC019539 TaxID=3365063 RepID=UPI0037A10C95